MAKHKLVSTEYDPSIAGTERVFVCEVGCDDCYVLYNFDDGTKGRFQAGVMKRILAKKNAA